MYRRSGLYRLTLVVIVLAFLGGGGYLVYQQLTPTDVVAENQKAAEQAYEEGKQFFENNEGEKAKAKCFGTNHVLTQEKPARRSGGGAKKQKTAEQNRKLAEQAAWLLCLKAQTLCDQAFADATELTATHWRRRRTRSRKKSREWLGRFPTPHGTRGDAANCVMEGRSDSEKGVANPIRGLRPVSGEPYDWPRIEEYANNVLAIDSKNVRAHWLLAQF